MQRFLYIRANTKTMENMENVRSQTPPKGRQQSETVLQQKCFIWFTEQFPELHGLLWHNYNNPRNAINGNQLKSMGLIAGIPDMSFAVEKELMYLELKTQTGRVSDVQQVIHEQLKTAGFDVEIIRDVDEFKRAIVDFLDCKSHGDWSYSWDYDENTLERVNRKTDKKNFVV